mgnify:CR=1 FL=1
MQNYATEYVGGWLFITCNATGQEYAMGLRNMRGQCITRGEFASSVKSHGFDRACAVFIKLGVKV